uniref:Marker of proliferation Ki-67 n=2 Tax=Anabas testudineus TaxID=64144 RepID=A0AAQ6ISW7_ANATE
MKTPKERVEPVEDIRGRLLVTPKQTIQQQVCLTGVKRLMKTPTSLEADYLNLDGVEEVLQTPAHMQESKDLSEVADMKTPVIKNSPSACLTGIKRIMKTPKEESAPVENRVGVKRLMKTPREKSKPVEDHFGIKRLMKSPRLRGNAPVEDFEGLQELMEESIADSTGHTEINKVEDQTQPARAVDLAKEVNIVHEEPQDDVQSHVIDDVDAAKETKVNENVNHMEEVPNGLSSGAVDEDSPVEEPKVDMVENVPEEQPEVENTTVTEINTAVADDDHTKKSLRGRRAKATESKAPEVKQETKENSNDVCPTPVRGRRLKKTETTAPLAVRQTTRNSSKDVELTMNESATQPSKIAVKPKRGRNAKKAKDEAEMQEVQEVTTERESVPEAVSEQCPPVSVDHKANDAPLEKTVTKPRRGRKTKQTEQSQSALEQENVPQANMAEDASEVYSDQLEVMPSENYENKLTEALETARAPVSQSLPEVEVTTSNEEDVAVQKKSVRGRKVKIVESKAAENEASKDPAVPAPVRGRRGTKTEATAPPNVRQRRGRNAKSVQEQAVETLVTEISAEAVSEQTSSQNTSEEENVSAPPAEEPVVKPIKGRKMKTPVEPPQLEKNEVSDQQLVTGTQQPINTVGKPRRGRKAQLDDIEPKELPEDTVANVELGRAKRVRNAKQEEEKLENDGKITSVESTKCEEPVKKLRKTRKTEQDQMEPSEDIQSVEIVQEVPDPALVSEPVKTNEQSTVAAKPRRGGRKTKQESPVESTEVQEVPAVGSTDKPKRGARGKRVIEEAEVISVPEKKPDHEFEAEQKTAAELDPVIKPSSTRRVKTEVSQTIPAKRARRGAALQLEESIAESAVLVSQSAATSVEPAKRGRRAAAKLTTGNATVSSDQANSAEELSGAVEDDKKMSKRSVKWKSDLEVFEIPKATPVKAGRGRKSKAGDQLEAEEKNVSKDANKTEEKALSDKSVEAQPVKRARRGAKIADEAESSSKVDPEKGAEAETQPKTRRGRSAKK